MNEPPEPPQAPAPPGPLAPPSPPPAELRTPGSENPLVEYLCRRIELMERELSAERQRAQEAQGVLSRQESLRGEVEKQLKLISEQLGREKTAKEREEEKSRSRGRIDALEKRLDEMHQTWAALLKDAVGAREAGPAVERDVEIIREELRELARGFETSLLQKMGELDRRLAMEMDKQQERISALMRERAAIETAFQEQRQEVHQTYLKERVSLQAQFNEQLQAVQASLDKPPGGQAGEGKEIQALKEITAKLQELLNRPLRAQDEIARELEAEKLELMKALRERNEQLRAYTMERREVERSMGESLMALNREIEDERAKRQSVSSRTTDLELTIKQLEARLDQAARELDENQKRYLALSLERDELAKAAMAEAGKVRSQIASKANMEKAWEERLKAVENRLEEERRSKLEAESTCADLRAQAQTLGDHLARILREKDAAGAASAVWKEEKEQLLATLRKKDDMISILSSTFKNLLNKPGGPDTGR